MPMDSYPRSRVSRKQEIYQEMLRTGLSGLRTVRSLRWWQSWRREALYHDAELLHHLYVSILEPDFTDHDVWFLNHQVRWYLVHVNPHWSPGYYVYHPLIVELFRLVPDSLRGRLDWAGPTDDPE